MAVDLLTPYMAIRAQLVTDINAAWSVEAIHFDPPQLPGDLSKLPRAFVDLEDVTPVRGAERGAAGQKVAPFRFAITLQARKPDTGNLNNWRMARAQELTTLLTANAQTYAGEYWRDLEAWQWNREEVEAMEGMATVTVVFVVEAKTGV